MALNKTNTKSQAKAEETANEEINYTIIVTRAKDISKDDNTVVMFDMQVNGVTIYGCCYKSIVSKKTGDTLYIVQLPQRKGADGNYYNVAFFPINKDITERIEKQLNRIL